MSRSPQQEALDALLAEADRMVPSITARGVMALAAEMPELLVIDVRDRDEYGSCHIRRSIHISRGQLEFHIEDVAPELSHPMLLVDRAGARSLLAARALQAMGYTHVFVLQGGLDAWLQEGLPVTSGWTV